MTYREFPTYPLVTGKDWFKQHLINLWFRVGQKIGAYEFHCPEEGLPNYKEDEAKLLIFIARVEWQYALLPSARTEAARERIDYLKSLLNQLRANQTFRGNELQAA